MKNPYMKFVAVIVVITLGFSANGHGASQQEEGNRFSEIRVMWTPGLSADRLAEAQKLVDEILSEDDQDRTLSATLLETLLTMEFPSKDLSGEDVRVMESVALHIFSTTDLSSEAATRNSLVASRFLGRVRKEIIPDFTHLPVYANVAPPAGVPGFSGMRPEAIQDPDARSEYEISLQSNREKNRINLLQRRLARSTIQMRGRLRNYLQSLYAEAKISREHLDNCMLEARMNDDEKRHLLIQLEHRQSGTR